MTRADCLESKKPHVEAILRTSIFPSTALRLPVQRVSILYTRDAGAEI